MTRPRQITREDGSVVRCYAPGNAPDETLSDYVVDGWIDAWWEANVTI